MAVDDIKFVRNAVGGDMAFVCRLCGLEEESRGRFSWVDSGNLARSALGLVASETVLAGLLQEPRALAGVAMHHQRDGSGRRPDEAARRWRLFRDHIAEMWESNT